MNLVENKSLYPHLRDEDAVVVENAIKLAIDSVLNVLYGVNSAKAREYQRMVADRDKEIQRLESRLTELERELQVLRRHGCTCGLFEGRSRISGNRQTVEQGGFEPGSVDSEMTAEPQEECEMMLSLGVFARPSSHVSSQSHESILPSSPSRLGLDPTCTSRSSEASIVTEAARHLPPSPSSLVVKEEPCDIDTVLIQWEMGEERTAEPPETSGSQSRDKPSPGGKQNPEGKQLTEQPLSDPGGFQVSARDLKTIRKKNVPTSQLPEEAQRLKRAAWRAASRRYYARKIARQRAPPQRAPPQRSGPIVPVMNSQQNCFLDKRRKTLISELPESQALQRDAWRRYYERKTAFQQPENVPYGHLMENLNSSGASQGPNREGPLTNSGGIMCS